MKYEWTREDIKSVLSMLNLLEGANEMRSSNMIMIRCPFHKDVSPSLSIQYNYGGVWKCFAGCGSGTFTSFIYKYYQGDIKAAKELIAKFQKQPEYRIDHLSERTKRKEVEIPKWSEFATEEDLLKYKDEEWKYSVGRGISKEVCRKFGLGYDREKRSVTFPVYDENKKCILVCERSVDEKRFYIPHGIIKPVVYIHEAAEFANKCGRGWVVLCESIYNALTCWTNGIPAVALLGSANEVQEKMLSEYATIRGVMLAFDGDYGGDVAAEKWKKVLADKKLIAEVKMPKGKDVNDLTQEEFDQIVKSEYEKNKNR